VGIQIATVIMGKSMEVSKEIKNRTTIALSNPFSVHIPKENETITL
jgi:hypothetical protein